MRRCGGGVVVGVVVGVSDVVVDDSKNNRDLVTFFDLRGLAYLFLDRKEVAAGGRFGEHRGAPR